MLSQRASECIKTALVELGMDYEVQKEQLSYLGTPVPRWGLFRDDKYIAHVGKDYTVVQNREVFDLFDPMVAVGDLQVVSGGTTRKGKNVWMLLTNRQVEYVGEDQIQLNILVKTSHGTGAMKFGLSPFRFACSNSLSAAFEAGRFETISHYMSAKDKMKIAGSWLKECHKDFTWALNHFRRLKYMETFPEFTFRFSQEFQTRKELTEQLSATRNRWEFYNTYNSSLQHGSRIRGMNTLFFTTRDRRALEFCLSN